MNIELLLHETDYSDYIIVNCTTVIQDFFVDKNFRVIYFRGQQFSLLDSTHEINFIAGIKKNTRHAMDGYERVLCIRGYHVYQAIWTAAIGEVLPCVRELTNTEDRYAVAVQRNGITVGHLPKKVSRICSLFLRGGYIQLVVTGDTLKIYHKEA